MRVPLLVGLPLLAWAQPPPAPSASAAPATSAASPIAPVPIPPPPQPAGSAAPEPIPTTVPAPSPAPPSAAAPSNPVPPTQSTGKPLLTSAEQCAGCANGAVLNGVCYSDLSVAVKQSTGADTIYVLGTVKVAAPIHFGWDLNLIGVTCNGVRPTVMGDFNDTLAGLINLDLTLYNGNATSIGFQTDADGNPLYLYNYPGGWDYLQVVNIHGIDFTPVVTDANKTMADLFTWENRLPTHVYMLSQQPVVQQHCGLRGPDFDADFPQGNLQINITDTSFKNFFCGRNGSAIYMPVVDKFYTKNVVLHNNMIFRNVDIYGGGALYIGVNYYGSSIDINGNFTNNKVMFAYYDPLLDGSEHGEGGAIKMDWVEGNPVISGYFAENYAPDGASIQVMELQCQDAKKGLQVHADFYRNTALDTGAGARGACLRVLNTNASITLKGVFEDNYATERGGVFATNWISNRSHFYMEGNFYNNSCQQKGAVFSEISQFNGNVTISGKSIFAGNLVRDPDFDKDQSTSILWIGKNMNERLSEKTWNSTYAPTKKNYVLIGPNGESQGAINNWAGDSTTTDSSGADTETPMPTKTKPPPATTETTGEESTTNDSSETEAATTEGPETTSEKPKTTSEKPKTTSEKPKTTSEKPRTTSEKPEKTSEKPEKTSEKPEKTSDESESETNTPEETS